MLSIFQAKGYGRAPITNKAIPYPMPVKTITAAAILLTALATPALAEESTAKKAGKEISEAAKSVKDFAVETSGKVADEAGKVIEDVSEGAKEGWEKVSDTTAEETAKATEEASEVGEEAGDWFSSLKNTAANAWNGTKKGVSDFWDGLTDG